MAFALKRNLYCHALCPFGSLQELNSRISGTNLPVPGAFRRVARALPYALTWMALTAVFLSSNPTSGAYEPFPTLFGLEGMEIQWLILASVILGSLFIRRFFCRFFCPVGIVLNLFVSARCRLTVLTKDKTGCQEAETG
jgi:polyferredoxin